MNLSDTQLKSYGLPSRASMAKDSARWQQVLSHAKQRSCATSVAHPNIHSSARVSQRSSTPSDVWESKTSNWSGNEADAGRGTFTWGSLQITVPTVVGPPGDHMATWIGVGDGLTDPTVLVQAGIDSWIDGNGRQQNTTWWEVVPGFPMMELSIGTVNPGDTFYVAAESNYQSSNDDFFFLEDMTTGVYNSYTLQGSQYLSDSASAECIVERPSINGGNASLAEFNPPSHSINIIGCAAGTNSGANGVGNVNHHYVTMWSDDFSRELAFPGSITNGWDYPTYWFGRN
jgi:Peptidase A4 family